MNQMNHINQNNQMNQTNQNNQMNEINQINQPNQMSQMNQVNQMNQINQPNQMNEINQESILNEISIIPHRPRISEIINNSNLNIDLNGEIGPISDDTNELKYIIDLISLSFPKYHFIHNQSHYSSQFECYSDPNHDEIVKFLSDVSIYQYIKRYFSILLDQIKIKTNQFYSILNKNSDSSIFQTLQEILNEVETIKILYKNKNKKMKILISKFFYLFIHLQHPDIHLIRIVNYIETENKKMNINFINHKNDVKFYEYYITLLIIFNNFSLMKYSLLSNFFTFILHQFNLSLNDYYPFSRRTISRRIQELSFYTRSQLTEALNNCQFWSLSYDAVRDSVGSKKLLSISVLTVDKCGTKNNFFIDLVPFHGTGISILNCIYYVFDSLLSSVYVLFDKLTSVSSDNGGDSLKCRSLLKSKFGCLSFHCICHAFNLLFSSGLKSTYVFEEVLKLITLLRSEKYKLKFKSFLKGKRNVKRFLNTRWCCLTFCMESVYYLYDDIINFLSLQIEILRTQNSNESTDESTKLFYFLNLLKDSKFKASFVILLDILIYERDILNSIQGNKNNNNIINYYTKYFEFEQFLNDNKNDICFIKYHKVFKLFLSIKDIPFGDLLFATDECLKYIKKMNDDLLNGHLGHGRRFADLIENKHFYEIALHPLTCDISYFKYFEKYDKDIISNINELRNLNLSQYSNLDIFSLSTLYKNKSLSLVSSFLSSLKFSSYDIEEFFAEMKRIKTNERSSLEDQTLRDILNVKYNCSKFTLDFDEINFDMCDTDTYKTTVDLCLNNRNLTVDVWSNETFENAMIEEEIEEETATVFEEYNEYK